MHLPAEFRTARDNNNDLLKIQNNPQYPGAVFFFDPEDVKAEQIEGKDNEDFFSDSSDNLDGFESDEKEIVIRLKALEKNYLTKDFTQKGKHGHERKGSTP